jgi:hypothetical protein
VLPEATVSVGCGRCLLITCMGIFNPIYATERLQRAPADHAAQVLNAWSVSSKLVQAALMVIWGILATLTRPARRDHDLRRPPARHPAPATQTDTRAQSHGRSAGRRWTRTARITGSTLFVDGGCTAS